MLSVGGLLRGLGLFLIFVGAPYIIFVTVLMFWSKGKSDVTLKRVSFILPPLFLPLLAIYNLFASSGIGLSPGAPYNPPDIFVRATQNFSYSIIIGYFYVFIGVLIWQLQKLFSKYISFIPIAGPISKPFQIPKEDNISEIRKTDFWKWFRYNIIATYAGSFIIVLSIIGIIVWPFIPFIMWQEIFNIDLHALLQSSINSDFVLYVLNGLLGLLMYSCIIAIFCWVSTKVRILGKYFLFSNFVLSLYASTNIIVKIYPSV